MVLADNILQATAITFLLKHSINFPLTNNTCNKNILFYLQNQFQCLFPFCGSCISTMFGIKQEDKPDISYSTKVNYSNTIKYCLGVSCQVSNSKN